MIHYYLLDNNVYTILRKTPNAIKDFHISIRNTEIIPVTNIKHIMTPYSVMEAVAITIEDPKISLPQNLLNKGDVTDIFTYVLKKSKDYYLTKINKQDFLYNAKIQSEFTLNDIQAKDLEKTCVQKPLSSTNFEVYFSEYLAFDFAFKFDFPKRLDFELNDKFYVNAFFTDYPFITRLSKFRLTKKFWNQMYPELLKTNGHQLNVVESLNRSMRLKTFKDFLDCDIIHLVTVGNHDGTTFRPTIAFTTDDAQTVVNRVMAYKTHIEFLKSNLDENLRNKFGSIINNWQEGILVFCNEKGTVKDFIEVKNIKSF